MLLSSLPASDLTTRTSHFRYYTPSTLNSDTNPIWTITSNIATSDIPINQWSFEQIAGKLREALRNGTRVPEALYSHPRPLHRAPQVHPL